mmetsp:Transcript_38168/g.89526  ORF Transcript_38168/g.89526 Transcript_38168/m.89526 type:complete len:207 (-) Transcript_38168:789-1409(-)
MMQIAIKSTTKDNTKPDQNMDPRPYKMLRIITRKSLKLRKKRVDGMTRTKRPRPKSRSADKSTKATELASTSITPSMMAKITRTKSMTFHLKPCLSESKKALRPVTHKRSPSSKVKITVQVMSITFNSAGTALEFPGSRIRASAFAAIVMTLTTMLVQMRTSNQRECTYFSIMALQSWGASFCSSAAVSACSDSLLLCLEMAFTAC